MNVYGGIEAGGTKFVCALGTGPGDVRAEVTFPTTTPTETLGRALAFFASAEGAPVALGIGAFGPCGVDPAAAHYGRITRTPKPGWAGTDVRGFFARALGIPVAFDTDVNAALLGEARWGAGQGLGAFLYLTVGTGIGGGIWAGGQRLQGMMHPEIGHMFVPRAPGDVFAGVCPFHGDCLEGLATGPALAARWGQPGPSLPADHPAWDLEVYYLSHAVANLILTLSPARIILGGGVMQQAHLFPRLRQAVQTRLAGYLQAPPPNDDLAGYLVPPALGSQAGVLGALALAMTGRS